MNALVLGIPLPHITFDNYSFLSAPSLFDYDRIIVDMSAVSEAVDQARDGSPEHRTHSGQTVVNGPSSTRTFSLAELLRLRRLEAERALARGGTVICLAYPDVAHEGIAGLPGWRRYDWLPAPEGFSYAEHLLAGFGKPGVEIANAEHPFAPYVKAFGVRLAFRAYVLEQADVELGEEGFPQYARVFARSPGGAAVGVELEVGPGRVVLLPPLDSLNYSNDRVPLANVLCDCLERMPARTEDEPSQLIDKEAS